MIFGERDNGGAAGLTGELEHAEIASEGGLALMVRTAVPGSQRY